jgi:malate dehydrogenase (oxaloacetate-decarboxylating)(NADP+)
LRLHLNGVEIVDPATSPRREMYAEEFFSLRQRKGVTDRSPAVDPQPTTFASMMVRLGDADALIGGLTTHYPDTIRPALQVIDVRPELRKVAGVYVLITAKGDIYFLADATVNIDPRRKTWPRSPSGRREGAPLRPGAARRHAVLLQLRQHAPSAIGQGAPRRGPGAPARAGADGRWRNAGRYRRDAADLDETYPFSTLRGGANVLIFPNLEVRQYRLQAAAPHRRRELIGPLLTGLSKPVHVLQRGSEVNDIVHVAAVAVVDAQEVGKPYRTL